MADSTFKPTRREIYRAKRAADRCIHGRVRAQEAMDAGSIWGLAAAASIFDSIFLESRIAFELSKRIAARNQERTK